MGWGWGCLGYFRKVMFPLQCEADTADRMVLRRTASGRGTWKSGWIQWKGPGRLAGSRKHQVGQRTSRSGEQTGGCIRGHWVRCRGFFWG